MTAQNLLVTKLHIPPRRPNLVQRARLLARLDESLLPGCKLALISAPAGFGKTTLLSDWQASLAARGIPLTWLSFDESDNDPARFLRYLTAALERLRPELAGIALPLLDQPELPPAEVILTFLVNEIAEMHQDAVLVLEDYHLISQVAIHQALGFLLDHQPATLHLVISTRQDPLLPLARLRARGQICEVRPADLRFSETEAADFLQAGTGLRLSQAQAAALEERVEGWIAGLQMVALALRGNSPVDLDELMARFSGGQQFVFDYLAEEVLADQPPEIVDFLRQTAFLERLCPALCDAVTGRPDSQQLLRRIEQANLFLTPLDEGRQWFHYHRIFADFIRSGTSSEEETCLSGRAGAWFERQNLFPEAVRYYRLAKDWPSIRRLILGAGMRLYMDGEIGLLGDWLNALPEDLLRRDARLLTYQAMVMIMKRQLSDAAAVADQAEQIWQETGPMETGGPAIDGSPIDGSPIDGSPIDGSPIRGCLYGVKAYLAHGAGQDDQALQLAQTAIALLDEPLMGYRSMLLSMIGQIMLQFGQMAEAEQYLQEAIRLGSSLDIPKKNSVGVCIAQCNLGRVINTRGQRRRAEDYFRQVVGQCIDTRGRELPLSLFLYVAWAVVAYDANQIELAEQYLEKEFAYCKQMGIHPIIVGGLVTQALIQRARGNLTGALQTVRESHQAAVYYQVPWIAHQMAALEAMLRLQAGELEPAAAWAENLLQSAPGLAAAASLSVDREFEIGCLARTYTAQGRCQQALDVLAPLVAIAERGDCRRSLITLELLQAAAEAGSGKPAEAFQRTCRAIRLAAPEGYTRPFLDEGQAVRPLLKNVAEQAQGEIQAFARELLQAFPVDESGQNPLQPVVKKLPGQEGLVEPLSPRELEVLALMAEGLSKAEIAQKLYLTINTLKAHTNSIYGKLDAHNRMQAVNTARALKLI